MKQIIFGIIILVLCLGGCANKAPEPSVEEFYAQEETNKPTEFKEEYEPTEPKTDTTYAPTGEVKEENWLKYAKMYNTEHRFEDINVPAKCWLIGNKSIVDVFSAGNIDTVKVVEHTAITRVEHFNADTFVSVLVFDKSGQSISLMVSQEDAEKLLKLINEN